jgi:HEAT repeat protein
MGGDVEGAMWRAAAFGLILGLAWSAQSPTGEAQRLRAAELDAAVAGLDAEDPAQVRGALEALGLSGDRRAVEPIVARVRRGLPPELLGVAVDTLMILGRPEAGPLLFDLVRHRRPDVRLKAVQAVVAAQPRGSRGALVAALSDGDPRIRGAAAQGLGSLGATEAMDALFLAMERRVPEAAMAIAQLARPADVERFLEDLGRVPFDPVTPALAEMLYRDDLAERAKLAIVHRLTELATPGVREFLEDYVGNLPPGQDDAVRRAAEDAIPRIGQ